MRIDWRRVINDLQRHGFTLEQIALEVDRPDAPVKSKRTVGYWREGTEPRFGTGYLLLDLYRTVTGSTFS